MGKVEKLLGEDLAKQTKYDSWKKKSDAWQRSAPGATAPGNEPPRPLLDSYREFLEQRLDLLQKLNVEKLRERYGDKVGAQSPPPQHSPSPPQSHLILPPRPPTHRLNQEWLNPEPAGLSLVP